MSRIDYDIPRVLKVVDKNSTIPETRMLTDNELLTIYMLQHPTLTECEARQELGLPMFDTDF